MSARERAIAVAAANTAKSVALLLQRQTPRYRNSIPRPGLTESGSVHLTEASPYSWPEIGTGADHA